ncbi:MAG: ATP-grasp domain-containing protein [Nitrospira sp.]|nr:ATP-grasp domain-containing protein [Nitrospira sp.]
MEKKLGAGTTPATLCVLRTPEEVETYLPATYPVVIKPTHSSRRIVLVFSEPDYHNAKTQIKDWVNEDYFLEDLERNYAKLEKKIIVEKYIDDTFAIEGSVHCLSGEPKIISLIDRKTKERQSFDTNKSPLGVSLAYRLKEFEPKDWGFLNSLLKSSRILSGEFSYIRVDFYTDGERVLFGELTNLPAGANGRFFPAGGEKKFSEVFFNSWQK